MKRILITGSTGLLGKNLCRELRKKALYEVIEHNRKSLDLRETSRIHNFFFGLKPDLVIHTAAMTNVDRCEINPDDAFLINWIATREITGVCRDLRIPIIYISTDFVFDGEKGVYEESDRPSPLSVYGRSKLLGEEEVKSWEMHCIIRVSWLFGAGGKNFFSRVPYILSSEKQVYAVTDQWSCPTYAPALASVIVEMIEREIPIGTFHLPGEERATPFEFVAHLKNLIKSQTEIVPVTGDSIHKAPRPRSSVLKNNKLKTYGFTVPGYKKFLTDFMMEVIKHGVDL